MFEPYVCEKEGCFTFERYTIKSEKFPGYDETVFDLSETQHDCIEPMLLFVFRCELPMVGFESRLENNKLYFKLGVDVICSYIIPKHAEFDAILNIKFC